jgi:fructose-1,6-bisphosphatase/inositol monophosphatase family enzyme
MFHGADFDRFERLRRAVKLPRYGGDCYAYGLLASGHVDVVVEASLKPYDYLAQVPIIAGAGRRAHRLARAAARSGLGRAGLRRRRPAAAAPGPRHPLGLTPHAAGAAANCRCASRA